MELWAHFFCDNVVGISGGSLIFVTKYLELVCDYIFGDKLLGITMGSRFWEQILGSNVRRLEHYC